MYKSALAHRQAHLGPDPSFPLSQGPAPIQFSRVSVSSATAPTTAAITSSVAGPGQQRKRPLEPAEVRPVLTLGELDASELRFLVVRTVGAQEVEQALGDGVWRELRVRSAWREKLEAEVAGVKEARLRAAQNQQHPRTKSHPGQQRPPPGAPPLLAQASQAPLQPYQPQPQYPPPSHPAPHQAYQPLSDPAARPQAYHHVAERAPMRPLPPSEGFIASQLRAPGGGLPDPSHPFATAEEYWAAFLAMNRLTPKAAAARKGGVVVATSDMAGRQGNGKREEQEASGAAAPPAAAAAAGGAEKKQDPITIKITLGLKNQPQAQAAQDPTQTQQQATQPPPQSKRQRKQDP
jgi:hypothetical protein